MKRVLLLVVIFALSIVPAFSQTSGPQPVIQIFRETIKQGKGAAHEKAETDYVRALRKAKHPGHYVALSAMSGPSEAWFIGGYPSFAASEQYQKESEKEPLKSELETAESRDGALRETSRSVWAVFRKDLSYRTDKWNPSKTRFVSVVTARVRIGREEDMATGAKMILGALEKANIDTTMLCYQVAAGGPAGTYLFFTPMDSMKGVDDAVAQQNAWAQAMGTDNFRQIMRGMGDIFVSIDTNLLSVNSRMSYPSKAVEDADPGFWKPKPAAAKPAAAAKGAEKSAAKK